MRQWHAPKPPLTNDEIANRVIVVFAILGLAFIVLGLVERWWP